MSLILDVSVADRSMMTEGDLPLPANDSRPLIAGDSVRIVPEFQDEGDDEFERTIIEAPVDSSRVLIKTLIPGFEYPPTEWIEGRMLERLPSGQ